MIKKIGKIVYDTEKSEIIKKVVSGVFGDENGYEETLYKTENGKYFLYVNGGKTSIYPEEKITAYSVERANKWLEENA